ncbi:integral membrane ornithine transporter of mitochondria [Metschnikowia bicuspidata]|uniref:Integral membrane ornithine transporter of mitochondria n=1 Tax=Metschnikowia bicuspidata TaxID=27322 RepID=A0A4P9ZFI0_9ASCO|nr:integral membrane ornithine transporter of mitochondria [Metschnikowia bicuspidata]
MSGVKTNSIPAITGQIDESVAIRVFPPFLALYRSAIVAYATLAIAATIGYPFDTLKTRMQTYKNYASVIDCVVKSYRAGGLTSFYRGVWAPMVSAAFVRSLNVSVFTNIKPYCHQALLGSDGSASEAAYLFVANVPVCFAAGAAAGLITSLLASPFEFCKVFSQIEMIARRRTALAQSEAGSSPSSYTTAETLKVITKHLGYKGLYSGYRYHALRDSVGSGVYFSVYESFKWASNAVLNGDPTKSSPVSILAAGGISGATSWIVIFPFDTTKALIQKHIITNIFRKEKGLAPLPPKECKLHISRRIYRGLNISVYRSIFVNMVFFSIYEFTMNHFI